MPKSKYAQKQARATEEDSEGRRESHSRETMENGRPGKSKRRAILRLGQRIHGTSDGQHAAGRCQCGVWDRTKGLTRPGSLSGRK